MGQTQADLTAVEQRVAYSPHAKPPHAMLAQRPIRCVASKLRPQCTNSDQASWVKTTAALLSRYPVTSVSNFSQGPDNRPRLPKKCSQGLQHVMNSIPDKLDVKRDDRASKLLQQSRVQSGRQLLVDHGATALLPPAFKRMSQICTSDMQQPQYQDALMWMLQFTRNLCAAGDAACVSLLQAGVLDIVCDLTDNRDVLDNGMLFDMLLGMLPICAGSPQQH